MRRSICYIEPTSSLAGETNTWKFVYTTSINLPKNTLLRFEIVSKGRSIDWQTPETNLKKTANVIYAIMPNDKILQAEAIEIPNSIVPQFQFQLPQEVQAGAPITIYMGAPKGQKADKNGNTCQLMIQRRKPFNLYVDPTGKGNFQDPEVFTLDIKGNELHTIKVLAPSFAIKNKRFDVVLRFEDKYGNLTSNAPEKTLIELSHENLRENLKWKLFIPETGFITLPNLYFNDPGVYTIELKNMHTKQIFRSSPIKCFAQDTKQLFWGLLHGESERFDSGENIDSCLRHFRDEKSVNFYGVSPFESADETPNDLWKTVSQNVEELDEDERFATFLGFQFTGDAGAEGTRHIIYAKDQKPLLRKKEQRSNTLKKIYKLHSPKEIIAIPCLTMGKGQQYNFEDFQPEYERIVEIYNAWGCSENTKEEGNKRPIVTTGKKGMTEAKEGSITKALLANKRFGFVAGGLDDRGHYASFFEECQKQYSPGLTAVLTNQLSKSSIFEALYNRNCYATTGERIIVGLSLAGLPMGSETDSAQKPGLHVNRHLVGYIAGTTKLKLVELIRNGKVLEKFTPDSHILDFAYDDMTSLQEVVLDAKDKKPPFVFYYLRILQEDGHMAWSSPIWVDYIPGKLSNQKMAPKTTAKKELPKEAPKKEAPTEKAPTKTKVAAKKEAPKTVSNKKLPVKTAAKAPVKAVKKESVKVALKKVTKPAPKKTAPLKKTVTNKKAKR
ncbi:MAG: hypothetical protein JWO53_1264 [Chlamydiia bacterium]|nr:hypothetical protein [Chlamydiia bacterium]